MRSVKTLKTQIFAAFTAKKKLFNEKFLAIFCGLLTLPATQAFAESIAGGGYAVQDDLGIDWPFMKMLNSIATMLTGPLPMILCVIAMVGAAAGLFMGNHGQVMGGLLKGVIGLSIILFLPALVGYIRTGAGGATIFGM